MTILLDKKQLRKMLSISDSTIYRLEKLGRFPKRRYISAQRVGWIKAEIDAWVESLACSSSATENGSSVNVEGRSTGAKEEK